MKKFESYNTEKTLILTSILIANVSFIYFTKYSQPEKLIPILIVFQLVFTYLVLRSISMVNVLALLYVLGAGALDYLSIVPTHQSDVLDATKEALQTLILGRNPYAHVFTTTSPPHSPFPYLPGELFFYSIPFFFHEPLDLFEKFAGIGVLFLFAAFAPIVGTRRATPALALYVALGVGHSSGLYAANDMGLAFVFLCSILFLAWSDYAEHRSRRVSRILLYTSAVFLALALTFKATAWPFFPFIALYCWKQNADKAREYLCLTFVICLFLVLPFFLGAPRGMITNVHMGFIFHNDRIQGLNVWAGVRRMGFPVDAHNGMIRVTQYLSVIAVAATCFYKSPLSLGGSLMRGCGVLATALFLSQYAYYPYWAFAITIFISALMLAPPSSIVKTMRRLCRFPLEASCDGL